MSKPLFKVLRTVVFGDRQYKPGEEISDLDVEGWELTSPQIEKALTVALSKGQIEAADAAPAPRPAAPVVEAPLAAVAAQPNPETSG